MIHQSPSQRALNTIHVPTKGLPAHQPERTWALNKRRVRRRNSLIYIHWLQAEDKESEIALLSERHGLTPGRICGVIERMKVEGALDPAYAASAEVYRRQKRLEIDRDSERRRAVIENQIAEMGKLKAGGERWVDVEEVDDDGKLKTKRRAVNTALRELHEELQRSHVIEKDALELYESKPTQKHEVSGSVRHRLEASKEFEAEYERIEKVQRKEIPADAEIMEERGL